MQMNFDNLFSVEGKTVVITGGSRGIGEMMAAGFLQNGAKVIISSRKADASPQFRLTCPQWMASCTCSQSFPK